MTPKSASSLDAAWPSRAGPRLYKTRDTLPFFERVLTVMQTWKNRIQVQCATPHPGLLSTSCTQKR